MAMTFEGTLPSLLQGVSQQIPRERQPGQVGEQLNMLSDPVTGIRRRAGAVFRIAYPGISPNLDDSLYTCYIERGTDGRHLLINTENGNWYLLSKDYLIVVNYGQSNYLKASIGATSIQTASIAGLTYILNTEQRPVTSINNTGKQNPDTTGFFYAKSAAFQKQWTVTVSSDQGTWAASYSAPSASDDTTGGLSSARYVVQQLWTNLINTAGMPAEYVTYTENYLFFHGMTSVSVQSDSGDTYAGFSGASRVDEASDLPAQLPAIADGCMCRVGLTGSSGYTWYRFNYSNRTWEETGAYNSLTEITNMPLELAADDQIIARTFEGRLSGDEDNNEDPGFVANGYITGIASFQGRLVLLSGPYVSFSASGLYQRFYRSTVASLLDSDRIDISSASAMNSVFRTALQFNRDLVVFGDSMQAVVAGGTALTPSNASIALTSEVVCDSRINPIIAGQTALYPNRRSTAYAGIQEFIPSAYTASQYVSQDATVHLPRYIPGRVMKMAVSSVTNMAFVLYSGERNSVLVHEFLWGADAQKKQNAYHKWKLPSTLLNLHVSTQEVVMFMRSAAGGIAVITVDPREGFDDQGSYSRPYMDLYQTASVNSRQFSVPVSLRYANTTAENLVLTYASGSAAGQSLGIESLNQSTWTATTVRGVPNGTYYVGLKYESAFTPTPPMLKDDNDNLIGSGHVRLLRLDVAIKNSGAFQVEVRDTSREVDTENTYSGLLLNSSELAPGLPFKVSQANIIVPCRTNSDSTEARFSTSDTLEMNVLDLTFILRYNQRRRRT